MEGLAEPSFGTHPQLASHVDSILFPLLLQLKTILLTHNLGRDKRIPPPPVTPRQSFGPCQPVGRGGGRQSPVQYKEGTFDALLTPRKRCCSWA